MAGIAKGTVYNYYKNKDEMLAELGLKALRLLHEQFQTNSAKATHSIDKVKAICMTGYHYNRQYPEYFNLITHMERPEFDIKTTAYLSISHDIQKLTGDIIVQGQQKGELKADFDVTLTNYILWACCVGVVQFVDSKRKLLKNYHEIDTERMIRQYADMITTGIQA